MGGGGGGGCRPGCTVGEWRRWKMEVEWRWRWVGWGKCTGIWALYDALLAQNVRFVKSVVVTGLSCIGLNIE